jgi:hypothetical protein
MLSLPLHICCICSPTTHLLLLLQSPRLVSRSLVSQPLQAGGRLVTPAVTLLLAARTPATPLLLLLLLLLNLAVVLLLVLVLLLLRVLLLMVRMWVTKVSRSCCLLLHPGLPLVLLRLAMLLLLLVVVVVWSLMLLLQLMPFCYRCDMNE